MGVRIAGCTGVVAALVLLSSCSDVVRLPDCIDCRPVEMSVDQRLEVELGTDRAVTNDPDAYTWLVAETGAMELASEERGTRSEGEDEFLGGYSRYVVYTFEPTGVGSTQMRFEFLPSDEPDGAPASVLDITVNVDA